MKTYIVLLRGVMPTGKNKVPMAQLRQVLTDDDFTNVRTWIQSGNVILQTALSAKELEKQVRHQIKKHIGPDLTVVVRTGAQLKKVLDENPFRDGYDISRVFFVAFAESPPGERVKELLKHDFSPEKIAITKSAGYMYIPGTYGSGKLSNNYLEKKLGTSATMRNFNTMNKLIELSEEKL